jgi:hypothetical protein
MSESILFPLYRGQIQVLAETVAAWKAEPREVLRVRDVEEIVRACLDYPAMITRLYDAAWDRIRANELDDYMKTGEALRGVVDQTIALLHSIRALAQSPVENGHASKGTAELDKALAQLEGMKQELDQCWPWFRQQHIEEGRAEHAHGECLELEEAFAQIAGVDKETWRRRVEDHVRSKQS